MKRINKRNGVGNYLRTGTAQREGQGRGISCRFSSIVRSSKNFWQELLIFISQIAGKVFKDCFNRQGVFSLAHERGLSCKSIEDKSLQRDDAL